MNLAPVQILVKSAFFLEARGGARYSALEANLLGIGDSSPR
jgi:hypothetical protein